MSHDPFWPILFAFSLLAAGYAYLELYAVPDLLLHLTP